MWLVFVLGRLADTCASLHTHQPSHCSPVPWVDHRSEEQWPNSSAFATVFLACRPFPGFEAEGAGPPPKFPAAVTSTFCGAVQDASASCCVGS